MSDAEKDKHEVDAAHAVLQIARERLAKAIEVVNEARERGQYTRLPELQTALDQAWRVKVDAHLVFLETSLSSTIRRLTEYVHYMHEVTVLMHGRESKS